MKAYVSIFYEGVKEYDYNNLPEDQWIYILRNYDFTKLKGNDFILTDVFFQLTIIEDAKSINTRLSINELNKLEYTINKCKEEYEKVNR